MANPQVENGYIRIASELLSAMTKTEFRGSEFMILLAVISKTYGWNKAKDQISLTQFQQLTGMDRKSCARAIKRLVAQEVLGSVKGDTRCSSTYWIQKDYDKWVRITSGNGATTIPSVTCATRTSGKTPPLPSGTPIIITKDKQKTIKDNTAKSDLLAKQTIAFEGTWGLYPRKLGKDKAFKKYCKTVTTPILAKQCKRAVENYIAEIEDKGTEECFIKHGSSFFNMWQDYYEMKPFEDESNG